MGAPSSEQEGCQIAAEIAARPNLRAVTERILALLETELGQRRRSALESLVGSLDVGLAPAHDISDTERDEWLQVLVS